MKSLRIKELKNLSIAALLMAGAVFTACSSDDELLNEQPVNPTEPKTYTMTIQAAKGGDEATTRGLYKNGEGASAALNANWNGKEKVRVVQDGKVIGTLSAAMSNGDNGHKTTLTGTVTGFVVNHDVGFYLLADEDGKMDYTGQCGALLDDNGTGNIEDNYDFASYELTGAECMEAFKIEGSTVVPKVGTYIPFTSQQAIVWFDFTYYDSTPLYAKQLIVSDKNSGKLVQSIDTKTGIKTSSTKTYGPLTLTPVNNTVSGFNVALNLDGASDIHLRVVDSNDKLYYCDKANVTFEKGKYYRVTAKMRPYYFKKLSEITPENKEVVGWRIAQPKTGDEAFAYDPNEISFPGAKDYGVIAYVGTVPGYFNNFLAISLYDTKADGEEGSVTMLWTDAMNEIGNYAAKHSIRIGSTYYNTSSHGSSAYDRVVFYYPHETGNPSESYPSNTATGAARQGWRMPTITDWRYIFEGLCGSPSATDPVGITKNSGPYAENTATLYSTLNSKVGNMVESGSYWTGSDESDTYVWFFDFNQGSSGTKGFFYYVKGNPQYARPVFAY